MKAKITVLALLALMLTCAPAFSQSVVLGYYPQFVSYLQNGSPNAFGCVFTYASGTSTPQATYTDGTGGTLNPNPVPLSAGGTANIWFVNADLYRIVIKTAGGTNCAAGTTILTVDSVNSSLLNQNNIWSGTNTFENTVFFTLPDLQLVFGASSGNRTTLDIPPTSANFILHGPPLVSDDTLLSADATQTVENKNLTTGTEVNGCGILNEPGTYVCIPNNSSTATQVNSIAILTGAPSTATVAPTSATYGAIGVVVAGAGITGTATIQQSGTVSCTFDGGTVSGDYVEISPSTAGNCHDTSSAPPAAPPIGVQIVGQVLATGSGLEPIDLYGPGLTNPATSGFMLQNEAVTGTILNALTKTAGTTAASAIRTATSDTSGVIGITIAGAGTTGFATIQQLGEAQCIFDAATTNGDYVVISSSTAGNCHDSGVKPPTPPPAGVQVLGQVLSSNLSAGTYEMNFYGPGIVTPPQKQRLAATGCLANTNCTTSQTWATPFADTNYSIQCTPTGLNSSGASYWYTAKATTGFTINITALGFSNPGGFTGFDCLGIHD